MYWRDSSAQAKESQTSDREHGKNNEPRRQGRCCDRERSPICHRCSCGAVGAHGAPAPAKGSRYHLLRSLALTGSRPTTSSVRPLPDASRERARFPGSARRSDRSYPSSRVRAQISASVRERIQPSTCTDRPRSKSSRTASTSARVAPGWSRERSIASSAPRAAATIDSRVVSRPSCRRYASPIGPDGVSLVAEIAGAHRRRSIDGTGLHGRRRPRGNEYPRGARRQRLPQELSPRDDGHSPVLRSRRPDLRVSARRWASATMVSVGFESPPVVNTEPPVM